MAVIVALLASGGTEGFHRLSHIATELFQVLP